MQSDQRNEVIDLFKRWHTVAPDECHPFTGSPRLICIGGENMPTDSKEFLMRLEYALRGFIEAQNWEWELFRDTERSDRVVWVARLFIPGSWHNDGEESYPAIALLSAYVKTLESFA